MKPNCSVIIATYNRCGSLGRTLDCVLRQRVNAPYEVIVVDNASTDGTAAAVQALLPHHPNLRYAFERVPGPASARNTGVELATSDLFLFTDDDIQPAETWIASLTDAAAARPDIGCFGGRILPAWPGPVPSWLTREHWPGALALQDYGDDPIVMSAERPQSLATANLAIRRSLFDSLRGFNPEFRFAEDTQLLMRLWRAGGQSLYVPSAIVTAEVQPERLTKKYHRDWHRRHAIWTARMRFDESFDGAGRLLPEAVQSPTLLGIPAYLYRQLIATSMKWAGAAVTLQRAKAFHHEKQLWQQSSYIRARMKTPERPRHPFFAEVGNLSRTLARRAGRRLFSHS